MHEATPRAPPATDADDARLESLGYRPQLSAHLRDDLEEPAALRKE